MARIRGERGIIYLGAANSAVPITLCAEAEPDLPESMFFKAGLSDWQIGGFSDEEWLEVASGIYLTKDECVQLCYEDEVRVSFEEMEERRIRVDQEGLQASGFVKVEITRDRE